MDPFRSFFQLHLEFKIWSNKLTAAFEKKLSIYLYDVAMHGQHRTDKLEVYGTVEHTALTGMLA